MTLLQLRTFDERNAPHEQAMDELTLLLMARGFVVSWTGQEHWMSEDGMRALRNAGQDYMVRAVRHMPDLFALKPGDRAGFPPAWWDVAVNTTPRTPNFAIERAKSDEFMARVAKGERIVTAFKDWNGKWYAQWIERLECARVVARASFRGSHRPYVLVAKSSAASLSEFLKG